MAQTLMDQTGDKEEVDREHYRFPGLYGMSGGSNEGLITLKTNKPNENSLYTLLRIGRTGRIE